MGSELTPDWQEPEGSDCDDDAAVDGLTDLAAFRSAVRRQYLQDHDPRQGKLWLDAIALELRQPPPPLITGYEGMTDEELRRLLREELEQVGEDRRGDQEA